ncbi:hypothetical protein HDU67_007694 [Dinochytrium kinnereticum]|nr:hypothetical protein HDU67_007694 [Dinochytrium kinnereticum]
MVMDNDRFLYCVVCGIFGTGQMPFAGIPPHIFEQLGRVRGIHVDSGAVTSLGYADPRGVIYTSADDALGEWDEIPEVDVANDEWDYAVNMYDDDHQRLNVCLIHSSCALLLHHALCKSKCTFTDLSDVFRDNIAHSGDRLALLIYRAGVQIGPPYLKELLDYHDVVFEAPLKLLWTMAPAYMLIEDAFLPDDIVEEDLTVRAADDEMETDLRNVPMPTIWRHWTQGTYKFLASAFSTSIPIEGRRIQPLHPLLPLELINLVVSYLTPKSLLTLEQVSVSWFVNRSPFWAILCSRDGFACQPGDQASMMAGTDLVFKAVYFCDESRNRRRIDSVIDWMVQQAVQRRSFKPSPDLQQIDDLERAVRAVLEDMSPISLRMNLADLVTALEDKFGVRLVWRQWWMVALIGKRIFSEEMGWRGFYVRRFLRDTLT